MSLSIAGMGMTSQRTRDRLVKILRENNIKDERVLDVMAALPRHLFVDEALSSRAYENISLPIGHGQTISQPYMVARMTELLLQGKNVGRVLEIGTGSGYQTAVLSRLVKSVFTVERIKPLLDSAKDKFRSLRLNNVLTHYSDGSWGWQAKAPFDAIIVTAAPEKIPYTLLEQLVDGGRLIIPVGDRGNQELLLLQRAGNEITQKSLEKVSFVPLLKGRK